MPDAAAMPDVFVNGRFLSQPLSGVQRFGREIVQALDDLLEAERPAERWFLVAPEGTRCDLPLRRIRFRTAGPLRGHAWEQLTLGRVARRGVLVNTGNSAPLLHRNSIVVLHDAAVFRTPANFGRAYALFHRLAGRALARRSRIATVSAFSRDELAAVLPVRHAEILLVPNGWEHIRRVLPDDGVVGRLGLADKRFFVLLGNAAPNKNVGRAIEAFERRGPTDARLVLVGAAGPHVFRTAGRSRTTGGVVVAGRLTDAEIAGLLRRSIGLVFPSLYEGFGIPPLEALAHGCPVLAADIPPVREVCSAAATYFDPLSVDAIAEAFDRALRRAEAGSRPAAADELRRFSWQRSARTLRDEIALLGAA